MSKNQYGNGLNLKKPWPAGCVWPEPFAPGEGIMWDADLAEGLELDEEGQELLGVRAYYDELAEEGVLREDYTFNEEYEHISELHMIPSCSEDDDEDDMEFFPEVGEEYWMDGFDLEMWEEDLTDHLNLLKIDNAGRDPAGAIRDIIGYEFINENLLRQAFTRRAFAAEYGLPGCSEELEFIGDSVLNTAVTYEISKHLAEIDPEMTGAPFATDFNEGDFTKIRAQLVNKEHLSECAVRTGLDQYILYGSGEEPGESSREDMIEALIGAVAVDSGWNWDKIGAVIDRIICIQLGQPHLLLKETFYDLFNAWHQKHFGSMPEYEVRGYVPEYLCSIRFFIPDNDKGLHTDNHIEVRGSTRSKARELAAEFAYRYVTANGLWINLKDAGIVPSLDDSINQLQELYQKKYVDDRPTYEFREEYGDRWRCDCECGGVAGHGSGPSKTAAKKRATYMVIVKLLDAAGICEQEWLDMMYSMMN